MSVRNEEREENHEDDCTRFEDGRFDILFGVDDMLLSALVVGGKGAVGSTYNFAAPLYNEVIRAFNAGELESARDTMAVAVIMIRLILRYRGMPGLKATMKIIGQDCGPTRLPCVKLGDDEMDNLRRDLKSINLFERLGI